MIVLLVGVGWLVLALAVGLFLGGSIRRAEADAQGIPRDVPPAPGTSGAPQIGSATRVLVGAGAAPSPRRSMESGSG